MWRNYVLVGLRALAKNRTYAAINILGLALGLASCLLILLYVRHETSYDVWLKDSDRVFQVQATWYEPGQPRVTYNTSPEPLRDTLAPAFPQIEAMSAVMEGRMQMIRNGQPLYVEQLYVDPSFFEIFPLEFVRGSGRTALPNVTSIVLTETEAIRQFGTIDVIGRTLSEVIDGGTYDYTVTGVIRDLPANTHLKISTIARIPTSDTSREPHWGAMNGFHYVKLRKAEDARTINAALPAWEKRIIPPQVNEGVTRSRADIMDLKLVPLRDLHLSDEAQGGLKPANSRRTITTFTVVAMLILVMASINFINLSTARGGHRAREVALRKVLGASRGQLIVQFLGESVLITAIAMLLALALVEFTAPMLGAYLDIDLPISYLGTNGFLLPALGLTLLVGVLGGLYPAFYLSRFQPAEVLRANKSNETRGFGTLRAALVVGQFAISIGLIICTAVIYSQTRFVQTVDPGFVREGLIQFEDGGRIFRAGNWEGMRRAILDLPGVLDVTRTNMGVASRNKNIQGVTVPGLPEPINNGLYRIDPHYLQTMGMRLIAGRNLGEAQARDRVVREERPDGPPSVEPLQARGLNIIINRRAAMQWGFPDPARAVGAQVRISLDGVAGVPATVVGVVEDTRLRSARDELEPLMFAYDPDGSATVVVRYRSGEPAAVLAGVEQVWQRFFANTPFEGDLAEDITAGLYEADRRRGVIFAGFAALAVVIACSGLFGLAAFVTERRNKEIGIRKVFGARVRDIVRLLAWQFSKPVVLANLVAWPAAWWVMRDWLNGFDVRIPLTPGPFVLAGIMALAIALSTISGQAFRVARRNPIHALRYE